MPLSSHRYPAAGPALRGSRRRTCDPSPSSRASGATRGQRHRLRGRPGRRPVPGGRRTGQGRARRRRRPGGHSVGARAQATSSARWPSSTRSPAPRTSSRWRIPTSWSSGATISTPGSAQSRRSRSRSSSEISRRLRRADEKIGSLVLLDVNGRRRPPAAPPGRTGAGGDRITRQLTHHTIAQMIGSSRETVSRTMRNPGRAGVIQVTPERHHCSRDRTLAPLAPCAETRAAADPRPA